MFKKLDEDKINCILEAGISEFARNGFDKANMSAIARKADYSVGVIYKYFGDKDHFFLACVRHSLRLLGEVLHTALQDETDVEGGIRRIIRALLVHAREHSDYYVMYHEITAGGCRKFAKELASEIEKLSSSVYIRMIENAKKQGIVRRDMDSRFFAFFFDNLLMMLQFSFCCDYYKERMKIYCGEDILTGNSKGDSEGDSKLEDELIRFICGGFGIKTKKA